LSLFAVAIAVVLTPLCHSQKEPVRLTFDVASIRLSDPGAVNGTIKPLAEGRGYLAHNISVRLMIALMYQVPARQVKGGPEWLDGDRYDVEARTESAHNRDDLHVMFQNLLADRFNLKLRKESKEGPVYALSVDGTAPKMTVNDGEENFDIPINPGNNGFVGKRVSMQYLSWWLGLQLQNDERPVVDETGLDKNYDFTLTFMPVLPPDRSRDDLPAELRDRPSIFDALKAQLGLKLQAQKGPVTYYVVDHVERPSAN
jgi:uncharacterized protein (TIGR03435 family)